MRLFLIIFCLFVEHCHTFSLRDAEFGPCRSAFARVGVEPALQHALFYYAHHGDAESQGYPGLMSSQSRLAFEERVLQVEQDIDYPFAISPLKDYHVGHVPGDGDCLFWAAGTTRDAFLRFVYTHRQDPMVRRPLIQWLRNDLVRDVSFFDEDPIGLQSIRLYRQAAKIGAEVPSTFSDEQLRLYMDLVMRQNPTFQGPRFSLADSDMATLLSLHLGKNVCLYVEEQLEDEVLQAMAESLNVTAYTLEDFREALQEKYGLEAGLQHYLDAGLCDYPLLNKRSQSPQAFPSTVSVIQRGNHFERLLMSPQERKSYEAEIPSLREKYRRHKAIWRVLREVVQEPVVTAGPVAVHLTKVTPLMIWRTLLGY